MITGRQRARIKKANERRELRHAIYHILEHAPDWLAEVREELAYREAYNQDQVKSNP